MLWSRISRRTLVVVALGLALAGVALPISADQGAGEVTVEATNNAAIVLSVSDTTADFGSNLDPIGTKSNSSDGKGVSVFTDAGGSYYVWGSENGNGMVVTVKSNTPWIGKLGVSRSTGTSHSMTIDSGVLRYSQSEPRSYYDAALSEPFSTATSTFESSGGKGVSKYNYFYSLRVGWDDDPGTFKSSVTYSVTH